MLKPACLQNSKPPQTPSGISAFSSQLMWKALKLPNIFIYIWKFVLSQTCFFFKTRSSTNEPCKDLIKQIVWLFWKGKQNSKNIYYLPEKLHDTWKKDTKFLSKRRIHEKHLKTSFDPLRNSSPILAGIPQWKQETGPSFCLQPFQDIFESDFNWE